jgi:hypothetical protein
MRIALSVHIKNMICGVSHRLGMEMGMYLYVYLHP